MELQIKLDDESTKIYESMHPAHRNTALNLGLRLLVKDPIFKTLFLMNEYKDEFDEPELVQVTKSYEDSNSSPSTKTNESVPKVQKSWDNF